ncbi:NAD-dependent epimerase/dehydratase family protein [Cellulomonas algicola]|uniref:NAD-dependent epimerase/dehydratase domain-containing protein n=1 Tax=Cellulomonas algicola TaxID=2071633 RepID=A0A401V1Q2_9CELL|nr:NAD(P)-dependent oxidoreductase [Cellulomonas algicola]GCD20837.1 hypothetical protein CTKZ_23990 [Cellulomonas algicola]
MTTVLVGASGHLGTVVADLLGDVVAVPARDVLERGPDAMRGVVRPGAVVVNAAGARRGEPEALRRLNVELVAALVTVVDETSGHLVQLGSAAEYGTAQPGGLCAEDAEPAPESPYGVTKAEGTQCALASGRATVLRVFNVASEPPQDGTPLADVVARVARARAGSPVELISAATVRDWVRPSFVARSVERAVRLRPVGVFNVASGEGVAMGDAVAGALDLLGVPAGVHDLAAAPASTVVGTADLWRSTSGLAEAVTTSDLAALVARHARATADLPEEY